MTDDEAFAFYADPANQRPGARAKRTKSAMTGHVPVRFSDELIAWVKAIAAQDGLTVSSWIRNLVTKEVERRLPPTTATTTPATPIRWEVEPPRVFTRGYERDERVPA